MTHATAYSVTQAVQRAVTLLKLFSDARPEWSLPDLARAAGLHKTTAFRLLTALASEGLVARAPGTQGYRLGPGAITLGARALRASDLRTVGRPALEELAERSGETATLETRVAGEVLIIDEVHRHGSLQALPSVGTRWPAHATSTGKVLLAELAESERAKLLRAPLARRTRRTIATLAALRNELRRVRAQGYATAVGELEDGYSAIGVAVRDHDERVVAAVSVGGPSARLPVTRLMALLPILREAAGEISRRLGHPDR